MRKYIPLGVPVTFLLVICCTRPSFTVAGDSFPSNPDDATHITLDSLQHAIANRRLELSTADTSDSKQFCFEFVADCPPTDESAPFRILVLRDHDRVAMLVRDLNGDFYTYVTDRLMIAIDHHHPGSFLILRLTTYFPEGSYERVPPDQVKIAWGYIRSAVGHEIMVAFGDTLRDLLSAVKLASYDSQSNSYTLITPNCRSKLTLNPSADPGAFAVKEFVNSMPGGSMIGFSFIDPKGIPANYRGLLADVAAIDAAITKCGAPIEDLTQENDKAINEAILKAFMVPGDLASDPRERTATSRMANILMPQVAATQPASGR